MFKNVAAKFIVFAFDATTNVPKTADAANITAYVSKDYGAVTPLADTSATEMDATNAPGYYLFDAAQGETNADCLLVSGKSTTANIKVIGAPAVIYTRPTTGWLAPATAGRTLAVDGSGFVTVVTNNDKTGYSLSGAQSISSLIVSGAFTVNGGVAFNSSTGDAFACTSTGGGGHGMLLQGNGVGDGIHAIGGATNADGFHATGQGSGDGFHLEGGANGHGIHCFSGGTSGAAMLLESITSGIAGLEITNVGGSPVAVLVTGNASISGTTTLTGAVTATNASNDLRLGATERTSIATAWGASVVGNSRTRDMFLQGLTNKIAFDVPGAGQFTLYSTDDTTPLKTGTYTAAAVNPVTVIDPA